MKSLKDFFVRQDQTIKEAMSQISINSHGVAFVINKSGKFVGVVTDGDVRRVLIKGVSIDDRVKTITKLQSITLSLKEKNNHSLIPMDMIPSYPKNISLKVPILGENRQVVDVLFVSRVNGRIQSELFSHRKKPLKTNTNIRRVLVIGGGGYLGSVLCNKLLDQGYQVKVLDNLMYSNEGIQQLLPRKDFKLIKGDIRSIIDTTKAIRNIDSIIHLAGIVGDPASSISPEQTLAINLHSTKLIVEIAKYYQVNRFIFASTCSVYGKNFNDRPLDEKSELNPISLYARTKIQSEKIILAAKDERFTPIILRMATIYGLSPRMRFDLVVNLLAAKAYFEKKIPIYGGKQYRPFIHVQDAADAYLRCLRLPSNFGEEVINIGSNRENYQILEIGKIIGKIFPGAKLKISKNEADERDYFVDFSKAKKVLRLIPKWNVKQGVEEIRKAMRAKTIVDYQNRKYSNYKSLRQ